VRYAVCLFNEDRWCPIDEEVEVSSLIEALSRIGDRYKAENLGYQENVPNAVKLYATGYDELRKIGAIKEMRNFTSMGLKEAKDAVESLDNGGKPFFMGEFTLDKARAILRGEPGVPRFLDVNIDPDTHPGVSMILKLQKSLGGTSYAR